MNKIILFDLDGTLIDSTDAILECFNRSFKLLNFNFQGTDEDIKKLIGYPLDVMYVQLGVEDKDKWTFVDTYKAEYRKISVENTYILDKALEAVQEASKIARVGVVTTKTRIYSIPILENLGLNSYFDAIIGREDVENPKPHEEPILKALKQMNHTNEKVWMIGDTKMDLLSASNAKVNSIGVLCGYASKEELNEYTDFIVNNAYEAVSFIKMISKD